MTAGCNHANDRLHGACAWESVYREQHRKVWLWDDCGKIRCKLASRQSRNWGCSSVLFSSRKDDGTHTWLSEARACSYQYLSAVLKSLRYQPSQTNMKLVNIEGCSSTLHPIVATASGQMQPCSLGLNDHTICQSDRCNCSFA